MADKYKPDELKEDAAVKKLIVDTAVDVQCALQFLISKNIVTKQELDDMRGKIRSIPKYKAAYEVINKLNQAADLYQNDPQAYLKALFEEKLRGGK